MNGFKARPDAPGISFTINGEPATAPRGASVATALLLAGRRSFGPHPVSGQPEGPWCLIGVCFGCLVTIDDTPGRQSCLVPVQTGMSVRTRPRQQ